MVRTILMIMMYILMASKKGNEIKQSQEVCDDLDESTEDVDDKDHDYESKENLDIVAIIVAIIVIFLPSRRRSDSPVGERERGTFSFYQAHSSNFQSLNYEFSYFICNNL